MNNIDTRIVEMQFENGKFERDAANTIATLEKLDASLDFKNAATAFKDITAAANNVSLQGIEAGIEWIEKRFGLMGSAIFKVFDNITNRAFSMGENLVKSVTIKPAIDGWEEYNLKTKSTQTILNNVSRLGNDMDDVNRALDTLNEYADKTTYSFAGMVQTISGASNAGLNIDQLLDYSMGLSNLAAYAGVDNTAMQRAGYQINQALNKGYFEAIDWKSLTNANLDTAVFRDTIKQVAEENGLDVDALIAASTDKTFQNSLTESKWLTNDIFLEALGRFTDENTELGKAAFDAATKTKTLQEVIDQITESLGSGWTKTFELLVGDVEKAKEFWTPITNSILEFTDGISDSRNKLLDLFARMGGRQIILDTILGLLDNIKWMISAISGQWSKLFKQIKARDLKRFANGVKTFVTTTLAPTPRMLYIIQGLVKGVATVVKTAGTILEGVWIIAQPLLKIVLDLADAILYAVASLGHMSEDGQDAVDWAGIFLTASQAIADVIKDIPENVTKMWESIKEGWENIREIVKDRTGFDINQPFVDAYNAVTEFVTHVEESIADGSLWQKVQDAVAPIGDFFKGLFGGAGEEGSDSSISTMIGNTVSNIIDKFNELKTTIENLTIADALNGLNEKLKKPVDTFKEMFLGSEDAPATIVDIGSAYEKISSQLDEFGKHFADFWSNIEPYVKKVEEVLKPAADAILQVIETLSEGLAKTLENFGKEGLNAQDVASLTKAAAFWYLVFKLEDFVNILGEIPKKLNGIVNNLTSPLNRLVTVIANTIGEKSKQVKADTFKAYAIGIAAIVGSVVAITYLNLDGLNAGIAAMAAIIVLLGVVLDQITKLTNQLDIASMTGIAIFLNQFGSALLKIAAGIALIQWSGDDVSETVAALASMLGYVYLLYRAVVQVSGLDPTKVISAGSITAFGAMLKAFGTAMLEIGGAIALLTYVYSKYGGESFAVAIGAVELLYLDILALVKIFSSPDSKALSNFIGNNQLLGIGTALIEIAVAIDLVVLGIWALSTVEDPNRLLLAAGVVGGLIVLVGTFFAALNGIKFDGNVASTVLVISVALNLMAVAIDVLLAGITGVAMAATQFKIEDAYKAIMLVGVSTLVLVLLAGVVGLLGEIGPEVALGFITGGIAMIAMAAAVTIIAKAMADLVNAVKDVPNEDLDKLWKPILMMMAIMGVLSIASLIFMAGGIGGAVGIIAAAGAVWIFAQALNALIPAVEKLGSMDTMQLGQGLIALCIIAVVLVVIGALVVGAAPMLVVLSIAAIGFGVGLFFVAAAFAAFAGGLLLIAAAGDTALPLIGVFASGLIDGIVDGLIKLIKRLPEIVHELGGAFIKILDELQTIVINWLVWNCSSTVVGLIKVVNAFAATAAPLVGRLCEVLIDLLTQVLQGINNGLEKNKHELAYYIGNIIAIILEIVVEALYVMVAKLCEWAYHVAPTMVEPIISLGKKIVKGLYKGIKSVKDWLFERLGKIAEGIISHFIPSYEKIKEAAEGVIGGLTDAFSGATKGITEVTNTVGSALSGDNSIAKGMANAFSNGVNGVKNLLNINSPSKLFRDDIVGKGIIGGVLQGFDLYGDEPTTAMTNMADNMFNSFNNKLMDMDMSNLFGDLDPTITPVVDLSEVENSFSDINNMAGNTTFDFAALAGWSFNNKSTRERRDADDQTKRVEDLMNSLTDRDTSILDALANSSEDIKVYLDNDVLVGELYRGMDSKLGKKASLQRRQ